MASDELQAELARCLNERGYIVLGSINHYAVGYVSRSPQHQGEELPPAHILKETDLLDYLDQQQYFRHPDPDLGSRFDYFYRVSFD